MVLIWIIFSLCIEFYYHQLVLFEVGSLFTSFWLTLRFVDPNMTYIDDKVENKGPMGGKMPTWATLGLVWPSWKDMRGDSLSLLVVV